MVIVAGRAPGTRVPTALLCWFKMRQPAIITTKPPPNCTARDAHPKEIEHVRSDEQRRHQQDETVHCHPHGDGAPDSHVVAFRVMPAKIGAMPSGFTMGSSAA